jgi:hypothetical protein
VGLPAPTVKEHVANRPSVFFSTAAMMKMAQAIAAAVVAVMAVAVAMAVAVEVAAVQEGCGWSARRCHALVDSWVCKIRIQY